MSAPKPCCQTLRQWLRDNLGKGCLAPLTGTDAKALNAAVHVAELWSYADNQAAAARAFGLVVSTMQLSTQELAYHAIAMVTDWSYRDELWAMAGLAAISARKCAYEPGGSARG